VFGVEPAIERDIERTTGDQGGQFGDLYSEGFWGHGGLWAVGRAVLAKIGDMNYCACMNDKA
jgi:hypothetical protein